LEANADFHQEYLLIGTAEVFLCSIICFPERQAAQVACIRIHSHLRNVVVPRLKVCFLLLGELGREPLQNACQDLVCSTDYNWGLTISKSLKQATRQAFNARDDLIIKQRHISSDDDRGGCQRE
jgi:hypothetical protein